MGALNMGEYAYDFTGRNVHDGPSRNPHDLKHMTGGSSGGSAAAWPAASFRSRWVRTRTGPFACQVRSAACSASNRPMVDCRASGRSRLSPASIMWGRSARSVGDLALSYDAMLGRDDQDPAQADVPAAAVSPTLNDRIAGLRIARLGGYFARSADPSATSAVGTIARALKADRVVELAQAEQARSAAYLITMVEGAALHLARLREHARDFTRKFATGLSPGRWFLASGPRRRKIPPPVSCRQRSRSSATSIFCWRQRPLAAPPCSSRRPLCSTVVRCWCGRILGSSLSPYPHRPAGCHSPCLDRGRKTSDRRADHRCSLARRSRAARRLGS